MSNVVFSIGTDDKLNMSLDEIVKKERQGKKKPTGTTQKKAPSFTRRQATGKVLSAVRRGRTTTTNNNGQQRRTGPVAPGIKRNRLRQSAAASTPTKRAVSARSTIAKKSPTAKKVVNFRHNRSGGLVRRNAGNTVDNQQRANGNAFQTEDFKIIIDNTSAKPVPQERRRPANNQRGNVKQNTFVVRNSPVQEQQRARGTAQRLQQANIARRLTNNNNPAPARQPQPQNIKMTLSDRFSGVKQTQNQRGGNRQFGNNNNDTVIRKPGFRNNNGGRNNANNGGAPYIRKPGIDDRFNGGGRVNRQRY